MCAVAFLLRNTVRAAGPGFRPGRAAFKANGPGRVLGQTHSFFAPGPISQLPKLCVKITIFMQGHILIADWSVAHFVVIMNDVMNDNMAAFEQQTNQLSGRGLA